MRVIAIDAMKRTAAFGFYTDPSALSKIFLVLTELVSGKRERS